MSLDRDFDGWWEGTNTYECDNCHKKKMFRFDSEEEARTSKMPELKKLGWSGMMVNGLYRHFCCEECRNKYIRNNTI